MRQNKFMQDHHFVHVLKAAVQAANNDIFNGSPATPVIVMRNWAEATFMLEKGTGATGTATITVESCDTVVPGVATAVPFKYRKLVTADTWGAWTDAAAAGFTTTAGADQAYEINIPADGLVQGDIGVRLKMTEVANDPVHGGLTCVLTGARYGQDIPDTVLS